MGDPTPLLKGIWSSFLSIDIQTRWQLVVLAVGAMISLGVYHGLKEYKKNN